MFTPARFVLPIACLLMATACSAEDAAPEQVADEASTGETTPDTAKTEAIGIEAEKTSTRLQAYFGPMAAARDFSGMIEVRRAGKVIVEARFGAADFESGDLHNGQTLYEAASITKGVLAATLVMLEDDGVIDFDDRLHTYLPMLPDEAALTIDAVLAHKAGFPRDLPSEVDFAAYAGGVSGWLADHPERWSVAGEEAYSNAGYAVLAELAEAATGETFADLAETRVLGPAGMAHSFIKPQGSDVAGLAVPYMPGPAPEGLIAPVPAPLETGSSGLITTIGDLGLWARALTSGRYDRLFEPDDPYGSIEADSDDGRNFVSVQGSLPGYAAGVTIWPEEEVSIAYVSNVFSYPVIGIEPVLRQIVYGAEAPERPEAFGEAVNLGPGHLAFVGAYDYPGFGKVRIAEDEARGGLFLTMPDREPYWNFYLTPIASDCLHWRAFNTKLCAGAEGGIVSTQAVQGKEVREAMLTRQAD